MINQAQVSVEKVALVGAGESAMRYLESGDCEDFNVFTSDGKGEFSQKPITNIKNLIPGAYSRIVIASQYVDEIANALLEAGHDIADLYWYDFLLNRTESLSNMVFRTKQSEQTLYAVYDLEVYPPNFEIAVFLARAELERKKRQLDAISLIIKAGSFGGVSARGSLSHGVDNADWRVQHILIPMGQLLPSCRQVLYIQKDDAFNHLTDGQQTFPDNVVSRPDPKNFALGPLAQGARDGFEVRSFCASQMAKSFIQQFLHAQQVNDPFVTLSMREYDYQQGRNSSFVLYKKIAKRAQELGVPVVIVRDTTAAMTTPIEWAGVIECPVASFDIAIRMALYEVAMLNVSVSSGPSCGLMLLSQNVDFILTHILDENQRNTSEAFLATTQGITKGNQYPFSEQYQHICWSVNDEDILRTFSDFMNEKLKDSHA